jgi:hypothetical protein
MVVVGSHISPKAAKGRPSGIQGRRPELQQRYGRYFSWYLLRRFQPAAGAGPET